MVRCSYCDTEILPNTDCVTCHGCNSNYCFGCSVKERTYRNMSEDSKTSWRCQQKCKGRSNSVSKAPQSKFEEEIKAVLDDLTSKFDSFRTVLEDVKESQNFLSDKYDLVLNELAELKKQNKNMADEIKGLKRLVAEKDSEIADLQIKVNDLDQYGRRINLEISGVKDAGKKDTFDILEDLSGKIGVQFKKEDFQAAHPLKNNNPDRPTTLLVQFVSRGVRDNWMREGRKAFKDIPNGFLSWDVDSCHVALDKELQAIIAAAPEGEEARNGERLIQFASENLVTEVLIQPQLNTLIQCIRNLLSSFTKHRHIIHAGYTFAGNGSWIVQDGTFSLADLIDALQEPEVQRVLRAYEHSVTVDIHCAPEGEWSTARLRREACTKLCRVRVNPDDGPSPAANIQQFVDYLAPFVRPQAIDQLLHPSDVVGNIRFSHPTLYVFPGGQGDAALFGINGFNMLVDGGFARKACFWDFVRHLDRLDAVLMTRINNSNCHGLAAVLRRKRLSHVYPQIGHFFCNLQERKQPTTPDEEKVRDPLLVNLLDEGQEIVHNLKHLQLKPHNCVRDSVLEPINLYHKVGHGKLDMYVISPAKDSKELKEFLSKWHSNDVSLFNSVSRKPSDKDITFPFQNLVSICALLVWQPANPEDTITRILFPGSTPQHKIFEGLERLRSLDFMKHPVCTAKTLSPSSSTIGISSKVSKTKSTPAVIDKLLPGEGLSKPVPKGVSQTESVGKQAVAKSATIPVSGMGETKAKPIQPPPPKPLKQKPEKQKQEKDNKTEIDKNIEAESAENVKQEKPALITDQLKDKESIKIKNDKRKADSKPNKTETKSTSRTTERKPPKVPSVEKKDSVKSSPTTPKKSVETKINGVASKAEVTKSTLKPKLKTSPSSTPAKSTKEENNRKVVESKAKAAIAAKTSVLKQPKKDESVSKTKQDKKPIKKALSSSPVKLPSKTFSPVKGATKSVSKSKKESKKVKGEMEKGIVTDSSTVSTPSTVDAETAIAKEGKVESKEKVEKVHNKEVDSGKFEEKEKVETHGKDIDEFVETKEKAEEGSISEDIVSLDKHEDRQEDTSEKEYSDKEEEDEILIIEKVEIEQYGDDSVQDQESLESHVQQDGEDEIQKHLRDEAESEKKKDDEIKIEETIDKDESKDVEIDKEIQSDQEGGNETKPGDLTLILGKDTPAEKILTPENREQIEEEVQEIISSATDFVAKAKLEQSKESSELSAEGIGSDEQKTSGETKDLLSSPEKLHVLSDKNLTDDDIKQDDTKDRSKEIGDVRYTAEESQPDEKISTTVESGATTAPTLPEDERIPLDEIKEGIEEKYDKEDTKEKETGNVQGRIEQPTTLPQVSIVPGGPYEVQATQMLRDIVKTPDEVADLPVHEEVDGVYEDDDFSRDPSKSKEDLLVSNGKKDTDTKEEKKETIQEKKETLEIHETVKEQVLSKEETDKNDALREDIRIDEEELNELKIIRQKLEADDSKPDGSEIDSKKLPHGLDLDTKHGSKHEIVLETEPVHSMLKAPEKAELVMVTPDSAPDSPLHLPVEKKDKIDVLHTLDDTKEGKNEDLVPTEADTQKNIISEEIEESLDTVTGLKKPIETPKTPPASPVLGELVKGKDGIDIIPEIVELVGIPGDLTDEKSTQPVIGTNMPIESESTMTSKKVDVLAEIDAATLKKQDSIETNITTTDEDTKATAVILNTQEDSKRTETDSSLPDKTNHIAYPIQQLVSKESEKTLPEKSEESEDKSLLPNADDSSKHAQKEANIIGDEVSSINIGSFPVDAGESPKLEKEQLVKEKVESPKHQISIEDEKKTIEISRKETDSKENFPETITKEILKDTSNISELVSHEREMKEKTTILPTEASMQKESLTEETSKSTETIIPESLDEKYDKQQDKEKPITSESESIGTVQHAKVEKDEREVEAKDHVTQEDHELNIGVEPHDRAEPNISGTDLIITEKDEAHITTTTSAGVESVLGKREPLETERQGSSPSISPIPNDKLEIKSTEKDLDIAETQEFSQLTNSETSASVDSKPNEKENISKDKDDLPTSITQTPNESEIKSNVMTLPSQEKHESFTSICPPTSDKHDTPKSFSPVPSDNGDAKIDLKEKEQITLEEPETPKSISPAHSVKGEITNGQHKFDSPQRVSPVPSDKGEAEQVKSSEGDNDIHKGFSITPPEKVESHDIRKEHTSLPIADISENISSDPSKKGDIRADEQIALEEMDSVERASSSTMDKEESTSKKIDEIIIEKPGLPKTTISDSVVQLNGQKPGEEQTCAEKFDTTPNILPSDKEEAKLSEKEQRIPEKHDFIESIGPEITGNGKGIEQTALEKGDSFTSNIPLSSVKDEDKGTDKIHTVSEKRDSPKSASPVTIEKGESKFLENEPVVSEKHEPTKSTSPIATDKDDPNAMDGDKTVNEEHDIKKQSSPVPSGNETEKQSILKEHESPKSVSPVPSVVEENKSGEKEQGVLEKQGTPLNISPVPIEEKLEKPSGKEEFVTKEVDTSISSSDLQLDKKDDVKPAQKEGSLLNDTLFPDKEHSKHIDVENTVSETKDITKSTGSLDSEQQKEDIILQKKDTPVSVSPVPSLKTDDKIVTNKETASEKQESPKSISPVPSDKGDPTSSVKQMDPEKNYSSKSVSPTPSDAKDELKEELFVEKHDIFKDISTAPLEKVESREIASQPTVSIPPTEKPDTPKSTSPVSSEKGGDKVEEKKNTIIDDQDTPKGFTLETFDVNESKIETKGEISEKHETSKNAKSEPDEPEDEKIEVKPAILEKQETPKTISPVLSEKGDFISVEKEEISLEKKDITQKTLPGLSEKENATKTEKGDEGNLDSSKNVCLESTPEPHFEEKDKELTSLDQCESIKSISHHSIDEKEISSISKEQPILGERDSSKGISIKPSDKKELEDLDIGATDSKKHDSPKSFSPVPGAKSDSIETGKEQAVSEKHDSPKSISPVPLGKKDDLLPDKCDSPKSISPVPSELGKEEAVLERHDCPKSISPVPSGKKDDLLPDKYGSPKSLSPAPGELGKEEAVLERHDSPKSISPVPSGKKDDLLPEKYDSPKSISPVPSDKSDSIEKGKEQAVLEKHDSPKSISPSGPSGKKYDELPEKYDSPKSISPVPSAEDDHKVTGKQQTIIDKHESPKGDSPVPSRNEDSIEELTQKTLSGEQDTHGTTSPKKVHSLETEKETSDVEKHDSPKSISPAPSDNGESKTEENKTAMTEKLDTPKTTSPVQSEKEGSKDSKQTEKEKHDSPKSVSPVLQSDKGDVKVLGSEQNGTEKHHTPKSISPVPSDKESFKSSPTHPVPSDTVNIQSTYETETEKADIELSEKDKNKTNLHIQCENGSSKEESVHSQLVDDTFVPGGECKTPETSVQKGIKKLDPSSKESASDIKKSEKVSAVDSVCKGIEKSDLEYSSISSKSDGTNQTSVITNNQSGSSDLTTSHPSMMSEQNTSVISSKNNTNQESDVLPTQEDTVIEKSLESKTVKTDKGIKADSESTVPSNLMSSGLDSTLKESSADLNNKDDVAHPLADHRSPEITEHSSETKSGLHSNDISSVSSSKGNGFEHSSSTKEEISSSVHRMLVTGSSEDGGTETELCLSSVTKLPGSSFEGNLGNVAHITQEDSNAQKQDTEHTIQKDETPSKVPDVSHEQTVITTTVYTIDDQKKTQVSESSKPSDLVKTITTTTITKTFGDHPTTDIKTTEETVTLSGEKSSPVDIEKSVKKSEIVSSGNLSHSLKKELSDAGRSGTPASDLTSERELEAGGISTPHSDISSGQVSRAATHVWGESEGRPDSRHCDSDDDIPCSPMSATSHMAQSPPQFDFDVHHHAKEGFFEDTLKSKESSVPTTMTSSFYGDLPGDPLEEYMKEKQLSGESQMYSSMYVSKYEDEESKIMTGAVVQKTEDIDLKTAIEEHKSVRGEDLTVKYTNGTNGKSTQSELTTNGCSQPESLEYQVNQPSSTVSTSIQPKSVSSQPPVSGFGSSSSAKQAGEEKKDPIEGWGKPLGLPPPPKNLIDSELSQSTLTLVWNPADEWGLPLGLPSPAPPPIKKDSMNGEIDAEITSNSNKTTPKKVARRNAENNKSASNTIIGKEASNKSKHPESPIKRASNKDAKSKSISPVYMDLTYVPHHGNSNYTNVEFFKRIRARYYVFSGTEPSREVFNALLEAKQTWEDKDLEVTIIPTYDTDTLGYWVAENEDLLAKYKIDLSPSASRCTINLQDHETSCSAYRLEF